MKQCPNCKCQVGTGIAVCPYCGFQLPMDSYYGTIPIKEKNYAQAKTQVPVTNYTPQPVMNYAAQPTANGYTEIPMQQRNRYAAADYMPYPINTIKATNTASAAGYSSSYTPYNYGTYPIYESQNPTYYSGPQTFPVPYSGYQELDEPQGKEKSDNLYLILMVLLVFMAFTVVELIILLIIMLG